MTQEEREKLYDEEIAPQLLAIVRRCKELDFHMVAHVEWFPGETGITQNVPDGASAQMRMTQLAAMAHGNIDSMCLNLLRHVPGCEQSIFLHEYAKNRKDR